MSGCRRKCQGKSSSQIVSVSLSYVVALRLWGMAEKAATSSHHWIKHPIYSKQPHTINHRSTTTWPPGERERGKRECAWKRRSRWWQSRLAKQSFDRGVWREGKGNGLQRNKSEDNWSQQSGSLYQKTSPILHSTKTWLHMQMRTYEIKWGIERH